MLRNKKPPMVSLSVAAYFLFQYFKEFHGQGFKVHTYSVNLGKLKYLFAVFATSSV